jgi:hypothetical protein
VHPTSTRPKITVTDAGAGVVSHAGSRLLADLADATTLTGELGVELAVSGRRRVHDPGRMLVDMAVAVADGARTISDVAVLEDQPALFSGGGVVQSRVRAGLDCRPWVRDRPPVGCVSSSRPRDR